MNKEIEELQLQIREKELQLAEYESQNRYYKSRAEVFDKLLKKNHYELGDADTRALVNPTTFRTTSKNFTRYSKEQIESWLLQPQTNSANIRNASMYMFINSTHYFRLIEYYAKMPLWQYTLMPYKNDTTKMNSNVEKYLAQYEKIATVLENMNLKHEFQKVSTIALVEDMYYGLVWETKDSFFFQRVNPDYCMLTSVEDGLFNYAIDMSKIKEEDLVLYPEVVTQMFNEYATDGQKYKEVPVEFSACFKMNESLEYSLPIFSGTMPEIFDISDYKALQMAKTEMGNYKVVNMQIPNETGDETKLFEDINRYYGVLASAVPERVGISMSPTKLDVLSFDRSGLADSNDVINSEENFWSSSGTNSMLFGGGDRTSSGALKLSIETDEALMIGFMNQIERWINRRLKMESGVYKFKIHMLPVTKYNQQTMFNIYKDAATLGLPTKSFLCASTGLQPIDIVGMSDLENTVLGLSTKFVPLSSSYTQSGSTEADGGDGRPTNESVNEPLTDDGEKTAELK